MKLCGPGQDIVVFLAYSMIYIGLVSLEGSREVGRQGEGGIRAAEPNVVACIDSQ